MLSDNDMRVVVVCDNATLISQVEVVIVIIIIVVVSLLLLLLVVMVSLLLVLHQLCGYVCQCWTCGCCVNQCWCPRACGCCDRC